MIAAIFACAFAPTTAQTGASFTAALTAMPAAAASATAGPNLAPIAARCSKSNRPFAESVMCKNLEATDADVLASSWEAYSETFVRIPDPSVPGLQEIIDESGWTNVKPQDFIDSFVNELEDSG